MTSVSHDRRPVDQCLPPSIAKELRELAASDQQVTSKMAGEFERRHDLHARFGVSARRLLYWLKRRRREHSPTPTDISEDGATATIQSPSNQRLRAYRQRQKSIASILESCFGGPASCKPELWQRRAYLMVIGLVYERLAAGEDDLPTAELATLARVLVDARRALGERAKESERTAENGEVVRPPGALPETFREAVRRVYGTNFQSPTETADVSNPEATEQQSQAPSISEQARSMKDQ